MVLDETPEQRRRRLDAANARARARRSAIALDETPEQRRRRLDAVNARARARRASESPEEARRRRERANARTRARRLDGGEAITRERRNERQQARRLRETEESRRRRLDVVNERARLSRGILTAQRRALRDRATEQQRADESRRRADERVRERLAEADALEGFGAQVLSAVELTPADIDHMASGQRFTTDPRLALAYYYCCGVDPAAFVFGDERLRGADGASVRQRLGDVLDGNCPGQMDIGECQRLAQQCEAEAVDVWACASCGRILLNGSGSGEVYFQRLDDLDSVILTAEERREVDAAMPAHIARAYRQLLFDGDEVYYLIPELVRDRDKVPLCKNCNADARKSKFSVACGHDYGRVGNLPALSEAALSCVIPTRCFGVEISLSGKHCSGHTICFPSDGPSRVARVLPDLDPACMPRVTFIGPLEEWRIQQHKYRELYAIPADDVYKVLSVLSYVNNIFREEEILIEDTSDRRRALHEMEEAIHANVNVIDSPLERDVEDKATSERYGDDVMDGCVNEGVNEVTTVNMRSSAVLPPVNGTDTGAVHEIINAILEDVDPATVRVAEGARSVPVIPIKQGQTPLVEWYENAKILAGAFPLLFLTGSGPLPSGPLPRDYVEHYMNYWDGRFEKSTQFTAMLFNQLQRHAAVRKAARAGLTHGRVLSNFGKLVNTADFKDALRDAKTNPERPESVRLNAQLLRLLSLVGGSVPFSPFERAATRPKLAAMRCRYGIAQIWATIAPPEHDDLLLHRIALLRRTDSWNDPQALGTRRECSFTDFATEIQTSARARLEISRAYPALCAQVFQRRLEAFTRCIIRCRESSSTRVSKNYRERPVGVYGRVAGFNAVIEPQVDGRLHAHFTIYGSAVTPDLLTRLACCRDLWPNVRRWFDAVSCTGVPTEVRDWCEDWRRSHDGKMPRAFDIPVPDASVDFEGFKMAAMRRVLSTNTHVHSGTCRKGVRGRCSCRLARPAGVFEGETQPLLIRLNRPSNPAKRSRAEFTVRTVDDEIAGYIDKGPDYHENRLLREPTHGAIVWEQHRPLEDAMFVETNIALACLSKSHTNSSVINGRDAGDMVEEYQQAYMLKEKGGLKCATAVMATALNDIEKFPSVADDSGTYLRQGKHLATRTVNAFSGATEWSHSLMAYALAGNRSYISSETFWYVFPYQLVSFLKGLRVDEYSELDSSSDSEAGDMGIFGDDDLPVDEGGSGNSNSFDVPDGDNISVEEVMEELIAGASESGLSGDTTGRSGGARTFKVAGKIVFVSQAELYRHRGKWFEEYSALEFEMIVDILPRREDEDTSEPCRGRPRRRGFDLAPEHPLSPEYQGFIRTKFRTAMLGGRHPPKLGKDGRASTALSEYLVALIVPWNVDTGVPSVEMAPDGLVRLCRDWNNSTARFVDRQRYRFIENFLQKGYRSARNEKACSEWRNRNTDFWKDLQSGRSLDSRSGDMPTNTSDDCDDEFERFAQSELAQIIAAASAKDQTTAMKARAARSTFWSLVPLSIRSSSEVYRGSAPIYQGHTNGGASISAIAKAINKMPPRKPSTTNDPVGSYSGGGGQAPDQFPERARCSPDQRVIFDHVVGGLRAGGKLLQTLTVVHGGGGTGKSTLIRMIGSALRAHQVDIVNTCPTGIGASHLDGGRTFHSAFKTFMKGELSPNDLELLRLTFTERVGVIVVDEMSMFPAEFLSLLDMRLRAIYRSNVRFGGRSIILAGDFLQLDVTGGTALCKVLYVATAHGDLLAARALFREFTVFFLTEQHRAAGCEQLKAVLAKYRELPDFYPAGEEWTREELDRYRPMAAELINSVTTELRLTDVIADPAWLDEMTILVTTNMDRAVLTSCAARLFAKRRKQLLLRWRRTLKAEIPSCLGALIYDEDVYPELFAYFAAGAPAHVLDNKNGNVSWGVANGTRCQLHSLAWDDEGKTLEVMALLTDARLKHGEVVDLPYPPDFVNVILLDSNEEPISGEYWPPEHNLETAWIEDAATGRRYKDRIIIPVGLSATKGRDKKKVSIGHGILAKPRVVAYNEHAVDMGLVLTAWKAQGGTLRRVLLALEPVRKHAPKWGFHHLYVGTSRVIALSFLRCLPLSGSFRLSRLKKLHPNIYTIKWRIDSQRVT